MENTTENWMEQLRTPPTWLPWAIVGVFVLMQMLWIVQMSLRRVTQKLHQA